MIVGLMAAMFPICLHVSSTINMRELVRAVQEHYPCIYMLLGQDFILDLVGLVRRAAVNYLG